MEGKELMGGEGGREMEGGGAASRNGGRKGDGG